MTHSIDAPLPPPATAPGTTIGAGTGTPSTKERAVETKDVAKDEAQNVKDTAVEAGSQVASTATDQAKQVVQETQRQAQDLLEQGRAQLKDQTITQQKKAADGLSSLAQELRGLADGSSQGAPGPARDLLQQASGMVETFAGKLQNREPAELLEEVRSFARRKPGLFLLGAAAAGIVAGRLTRGVTAAHSDSSSNGAGGFGAQGNYVDPAPAYRDSLTTSAPVTAGTGIGAPLPPPPYGTMPPVGSVVPPASPAGWDDPARRPGGVG
jgi:hypothetical protein